MVRRSIQQRCHVRTGWRVGLAKCLILADFGGTLARCIAVFRLIHDKKDSIVTGVISRNASAEDTMREILLGASR